MIASLSTALMPSTRRSARSFGAPDLVGDRRREALGREPRPVQRLADIDVAETGDDALVEERRLEGRLLALAGERQHRGVEGVAERLGAEPAEQRFGVELWRAATSFIEPKRRGSLKVTTAPDDM